MTLLRGQQSLGLPLVATDDCPATRHGLPERDVPSGHGQGCLGTGLDGHVTDLVVSRQTALSGSSVEKYRRAVVDGKPNTAFDVVWGGYGSEGADAQAVALATALDRLGVTAATVVGHDFGGPVALHLLARRPDLVCALGLLATNAFADTAIPFPLASVTWPVIGPAASRLLFSRSSMRMLIRRMVGTPRMHLDVRSYLGSMAQARAIRLILTDSLVNSAERYLPLEAVLSNASVPAAVIWGDSDPFFPLAHGERTAAALNVDLRVLPGAGHALPDERPDEVATVIRELALRTEAAA